MKHKGTLIAVKDIEKAKQFYCSLLGLEIIMDIGVNVELSSGVFLQTADTWAKFIHKDEKEITFANNAIELYFETDDIDDFVTKLADLPDIVYVHPLTEYGWGQRVVRFYDPDNHIIEVAENMVMVTKCFVDSGMTIAETAKRMDVPEEYVTNLLKEGDKNERK